MELGQIHEFEASRVRDVVISKGGQISIPAEVRRRWATDRLRVVDLGDRLILRPLTADGLAVAKGSLPLPDGWTAEALRADSRDEDAAIEQRRSGS